MMADPHDAKVGARNAGWLVAIFGLAVLVRSLDIERVFVGEGEVVFAAGDAFYHARRALYSFFELPALLRFDPCINFPDGAHVPHPPLLDLTAAALARLFGTSVSVFETTAAWLPVVFSAASVFPIYAMGRALASPRVGRLAAGIYAGLPICVNYGQLGNFDHHALAGLLGACLVWLYVRGLGGGGTDSRRIGGVLLALFSLRIGLMLTWTGSLLYLVPGEAALVLAAAAARDAGRLRGLALSAFATALVAWLLAGFLARPDGSAGFVAVEFSKLHALVYGAMALLCAITAGVFSRREVAGPGKGVALVIGVALPVAGMALVVPGVLAGLGAGLGFLGANDGYSETVVEQLPLFFGHGRYSLWVAHARMGGFVYLIPLVPIALFSLGRRSGSPASAWYLAAWTLLMAFLAVGQVRYAHDFAPAGCVGFAWLLVRAAQIAAERSRWPVGQAVFATCGALVAMAFSVPGFYAPITSLLVHGARGDLEGIDRALLSVPGSQLRFAQLVRDATQEEGAGCEPARGDPPRSGILAHVGLGHVLHYAGRRATPADPFGPYIGRENFAAVHDFWTSTNEGHAVAVMDRLATRYAATAADAIARSPHSMARRLHENDGSFAAGIPALGRFRLVTEGPTGGLAMAEWFDERREDSAPYKLFERVEGARLELSLRPGQQLTAELPLKTPSGRRFVYRALVRADADGMARMRVPYANPEDRPRIRLTQRVSRAIALGPYAMRAGDRRFRVHVTEAQVRGGATVSVSTFEVVEPALSSARPRYPR